MNIAGINTVNYGSTGRIMLDVLEMCDGKAVAYYGVGTGCQRPFEVIKVGPEIERKISTKLAHLTGLSNCFSYYATYRLIKDLKKRKIQVLHLHNLHISFVNLPILFRFIKKNGIKVIWTLHDCWPFTGHCPHYTSVNCNRWKKGCKGCKLYKEYPVSSFDNSWYMWKLKRKWFCGVPDMVIVTPSVWLKDQVRQSFLGDYETKVINNGVDLSTFHPVPSDFRKRHRISEEKFILLGVAFGWTDKKGLDVFCRLAQSLDSEKYQIVLVGMDQRAAGSLPEDILPIEKTANQQELAEIYSASDLFVNPTREETFSLVNVEALACGTPVLTFNTGGSPEILDKTCGSVVETSDFEGLKLEIERICETKPYQTEACINRAKKYDRNECYKEYLRLYDKFNQK